MELREGYKQTEVGVIPEDWNAKRLASVCTMKSGEGITSANIHEGAKYPCYGGNGLRGYAHRFTHDGHYSLIGRQGALCGNILGVQGQFFASEHAIVVTTSKETEIDWLTYVLGRMNLNQYSESSAQPGLSVNKLLPLAIPVPPTKTEQTAIANALSDADAWIQSLTRLIVKKRQIKQGAMQTLLNPYENGCLKVGWVVKKLGGVIAHCSSGATPYRAIPEYYKGNVKWITSSELNYNVIKDTVEKISNDAVIKTNLKVHPVGTFLMAITGLEAEGTRGSCGIVGSPATTNQSCMAIYPVKELKTNYLYHYYVYKGNELALEYCQGTKQQSYTARIVKILPIPLPSTTDEQTRIATILSDMDSEIAALETKLTKAQQIKQGMMQVLLTGRVRLI